MSKSFLVGLVTLSSLFLATEFAVTANQYIAKRDSLQTKNVSIQTELKYLEDETSFLTNFNIKINRNSKTVLNSALPVELLPSYDKQTGINAIGAEIKVIDLDADKEPEVLVDFAEAGAHCCSSTFIYSYNAQAKKYNVKTHFWGNYTSGYWLSEVSGKQNDRNLPDLNKDGIPEFVAIDDRFRGEFGGYALSAAPVQIWRYQKGKLIDVTREFPQVVYQNAVELWQMYSQIRSEYGSQAAQGAIAAYVATKFILGQQADALQRVTQAYPDRRGKEFISVLSSFLRQTGYAR